MSGSSSTTNHGLPSPPPEPVTPSRDMRYTAYRNLTFDSGYPTPVARIDVDTPTPLGPASAALQDFPFPCQDNLISTRTCVSTGDLPSKRNCLQSGTPFRTKPSTCSPASAPDRFIPKRGSPEALSKTFRMSRPPHKLSNMERMFRHHSMSRDPFTATVHDRTREAQQVLQRTRQMGSGPLGATGVLSARQPANASAQRQVSAGAIWMVGGALPPPNTATTGVPNGRGGMIGSGTNAPMYNSRFLDVGVPDHDGAKHEGRVAMALNLDQTARLLNFTSEFDHQIGTEGFKVRRTCSDTTGTKSKISYKEGGTVWEDGKWINHTIKKSNPRQTKPIPATPFRYLRDDFYCSLLAYSRTTHSLAVGLHNRVYIWSEQHGVQPMTPFPSSTSYLTSLSFSSAEGGNSILAIGRADGQISLWSMFEESCRFEAKQPRGIACLSFKPTTTRRRSERDPPLFPTVDTEQLLVGDEAGNIYLYSIEWSDDMDHANNAWHGAMILLAKITVHTQQVCGLAWSVDGEYFATGGNDNVCALFEAKTVVKNREQFETYPGPHPEQEIQYQEGFVHRRVIPGRGGVDILGNGTEKHRWIHGAAVKAIAFCPWQRGIVATGGGSNDRCIHFFHTFSGACLATINVFAQVTSLIWSTTRREIAATFGYAQPDHPYRIGVFSWPDCKQIVAIPWAVDMRALSAIAYPGGPDEAGGRRAGREGGLWGSRTAEEGCIVVASSDESVKFHEIWSAARNSTSGIQGLLGGSDILEELEGIEKEGEEVIR